MLSAGVEPMLVWMVGTALFWIVIPGALIYVVRRFLRAYERRTEAMERVGMLEMRLARLEAQQDMRPASHGSP